MKYKKGDVVKIKGQDQIFTVEYVRWNDLTYDCFYNDNGRIRTKTYIPENCLEYAN